MQKDIADVTKKASDNETAISGINTKLADIYTKSETNTQISTAVAAAAHLKYKKVTAIGDINLTAPDADKYIYLVPITGAGENSNNLYDEYMVIDGKLEKVGDWKVDLSDYATVESVNTLTTEVGNKVDKVEGKSLVDDTEITKLAGIAEGAEVNVVKSVKDTDFVLSAEGQLQLKDTVATAVNAVANKVDKEEGKSLVSDTEIAKLLTVKENAEPNYVKSVDAQFEVSAEGQLSLKELAQDKITGLPAALEGKVDKVDGKGLSKNDFTDEFVTKLNAIKLENIQANVIEKITLNGVETQVVEKTVDIPLATTAQFGLVKGSDAENEVAIKEDGIMSVNALNIQKLSQTEGETLVLDCGKA